MPTINRKSISTKRNYKQQRALPQVHPSPEPRVKKEDIVKMYMNLNTEIE